MMITTNRKQSLKLTDIQKNLSKHLERNMIIITGICDSVFDGRIKSTLGKGDRVLIIKKDGSILLHNNSGTKPVQWQKARAGKISFIVTKTQDQNEILTMESYRPKTDESFFISFYHIFSIQFIPLQDPSPEETIILGDEKDFVDQLVKQPKLIELGLTVIEREKEIPYGFIDIFAHDSNNNQVVIEVKKQAGTLQDAHQLYRYVDYFRSRKNPVRGILVANNIPKRILQYLQEHDLEACTIPWQEIFPTIQRPASAVRSKTLDKFLGEE